MIRTFNTMKWLVVLQMTYSAEEAMEKALLNIKGIDAVHPPDIPDDLDEYTKVSLPTQKTQQQPIKRPDTAPPYVMVICQVLQHNVLFL